MAPAYCLSTLRFHSLARRMTSPVRALHTLEFDPRRSHRRALVLLAVLVVLHTLAVWGYTSLWWGDHGRWLNEVERFANGEVPYRDFQWHFPPLAIWVVGTLAKVASAELGAVSLITALIFFLVALAFYRYVIQVAPGTAVPASVAGFLFATAYANRFGSPLPLGTVTPAGPVGMVFLLLAITATLELIERPSRRVALVAGACEALAVLSYHAYWVPAAYLWMAAVYMLVHRDDRPAGTRTSLAASFVFTLAIGVAAVLATAGWSALGQIVTGWGESAAVLAQAMPSFERLTVEAAAVSMMTLIGVAGLWLCLAMDDTRAARWAGILLAIFLSACAVHLGMTVAAGARLLAEGPARYPTPIEESVIPLLRGGASIGRAALYVLDQRFQQTLFPTLLPPLLLGALLWRWRRWGDHPARDRLLLLLGLAVALRLRRGFAGADWYDVLVEVPAYALFLHLVAGTAGRDARRSVSAAMGILVLAGTYAYYNQGRGILTRRSGYPTTVTDRGVVRWADSEADSYRAVHAVLERLDPQRTRPLFAFGQTGGWNYFFRRGSATSVTKGLFYADVHAEAVLSRLRRHVPPPLLVDNRLVMRALPAPTAHWNGWQPQMGANAWARIDRPMFERLIAGCAAHPATQDSVPMLVVYDCGATLPDSSR